MRVLVVDDNANGRQLAADILQTLNVEIVLAASGFEALERVEATPPDLILLDVNMPGMTGFEVLARLKADPRHQTIPVVMLTAQDDIDSRVQGLKLGADDYLPKPFSPRELIERVRTRLRAKVENDDLRQQQTMIRTTFARFVAPEVVERLLEDPTRVELGGKLQLVTVLFSDLQGFTTLSEQTPPETLLGILNSYHTVVVGIIRQNGGTIDKFIGDGVMALYNTPLEQDDHALRAVRTALDIRRELVAFQATLDAPFRMPINFGIHTGMAVVGNVGAPDIMNYSAVGDTINTAARLQAVSTSGQILISGATYAALNSATVTARAVGALKLRGRAERVEAYEVTDLHTSV